MDRCAKTLSLLSQLRNGLAESADAGTLGAFDVVGLDVLAVSAMLVEPKIMLVEVSLDTLKPSGTKIEPKRLLVVGIVFVNLVFAVPLEVLGLEEAAAFLLEPPLGVEKDVPNPEKLGTPCEGTLFVDVAVVPKTVPVAVEDEGFTPPVEILVAVVSGVRLFEDEGFVPISPPVAKEDKGSAIPKG